jgi:ribosomal protein S18 acetylase RimI-like enzyme
MLYVHRDNLRAIKLYQDFGFTVEPTARKGDLLLMIQKIDS